MLRLWAAALLLWGVDSFTPAFPNARSVGQQMSLHSTLYGNRIETAGLTVPMLKEVCKAKGLKVSGSRDELINRLAVVGADSGSNSKAVVEENKQEAKARRLKRTSAKVTRRPRAAPCPRVASTSYPWVPGARVCHYSSLAVRMCRWKSGGRSLPPTRRCCAASDSRRR